MASPRRPDQLRRRRGLTVVAGDLTGLPPQPDQACGRVERQPGTHRYHVTDIGLTGALFLTRAHNRLLRTGPAETHGTATNSRLHAASRAYHTALNEHHTRAGRTA